MAIIATRDRVLTLGVVWVGVDGKLTEGVGDAMLAWLLRGSSWLLLVRNSREGRRRLGISWL